MTQELYKKYRPTLLKHVIGQPEAVSMLKDWTAKKKVPHCILFSGPSGCGKTTLARIISDKVGCVGKDLNEINCADFRGVDMVRDIRSRLNLSAMGGGSCRVYLIDEAHQLSKDAQNALLKMLEDTPSHVYFFLATTHPQKLLPTIRTRSTDIKVKSLSRAEAEKLLNYVVQKEKVSVSKEVIDRIVECGEGSARKLLVLLDSVIGLEDEDEQLNAISNSVTEKAAIELAQALINPRTKWPAVAALIKGIDEDPEELRWMVLGYAKSVLLGGGKLAPHAYLIIEAFRDNFYDSKVAGLAAACYDVVRSKT